MSFASRKFMRQEVDALYARSAEIPLFKRPHGRSPSVYSLRQGLEFGAAQQRLAGRRRRARWDEVCHSEHDRFSVVEMLRAREATPDAHARLERVETRTPSEAEALGHFNKRVADV
jgi:hypothetical protein